MKTLFSNQYKTLSYGSPLHCLNIKVICKTNEHLKICFTLAVLLIIIVLIASAKGSLSKLKVMKKYKNYDDLRKII